MQALTLKPSRAKYVLYLLGSLVFVVIGGLMVASGDEPFWGWANVLFFGFCTLMFARELLRSGPRVVIDPVGVYDRTLGVGVVPWVDIEEAYAASISGQPFVCLVLRDPDAYTAKLHPLKRRLARANRALGFTELSVNLSGLTGAEPEDVAAVIRAGAAAARSGRSGLSRA